VGYNQEAYDADCAPLARAPETATRKQTTPERATIFTDAPAAIRCMASEDPGPGQMYAIPENSCTPQAGNLEEVGRGQTLGGRPSLLEEVQAASQAEPDGMVAGSFKSHASRFYQRKTGHSLTGQYLNRAKSRPTAQCCWCSCRTQIRDYLFKVCSEWEAQQKIL
jgi:hypothetical protein